MKDSKLVGKWVYPSPGALLFFDIKQAAKAGLTSISPALAASDRTPRRALRITAEYQNLLQLETGPGPKGSELAVVADGYRLRVYLAKPQLMPVVNKRLLLGFADGTGVLLEPGHPLAKGKTGYHSALPGLEGLGLPGIKAHMGYAFVPAANSVSFPGAKAEFRCTEQGLEPLKHSKKPPEVRCCRTKTPQVFGVNGVALTNERKGMPKRNGYVVNATGPGGYEAYSVLTEIGAKSGEGNLATVRVYQGLLRAKVRSIVRPKGVLAALNVLPSGDYLQGKVQAYSRDGSEVGLHTWPGKTSVEHLSPHGEFRCTRLPGFGGDICFRKPDIKQAETGLLNVLQ